MRSIPLGVPSIHLVQTPCEAHNVLRCILCFSADQFNPNYWPAERLGTASQFNPHHQPPGSEHGGEFAPGESGGGSYVHGGAPKFITPKWKTIEAELANEVVERAVVWKDGRVIMRSSGGAMDVSFTAPQSAMIRGADVLTHNHPSGASLSADDLLLARELGITEIRAVGYLGQRDDGPSVLYRAFVSKANYTKLERALKTTRESGPRGPHGQRSSHEVNKRVAAKAGFKYERYINGKLAP